MANYMKNDAAVNGGMTGFLCVVEAVSGQLAVVPVPNLKTKSWKKAILSVMEKSAIHAIRAVCSDRDSAVKSDHESKGLRAQLKRDHGVTWIFLKNRSKAYKVRLMVSRHSKIRALADRLQTLTSAFPSRSV
jgi:hypothetical protein